MQAIERKLQGDTWLAQFGALQPCRGVGVERNRRALSKFKNTVVENRMWLGWSPNHVQLTQLNSAGSNERLTSSRARRHHQSHFHENNTCDRVTHPSKSVARAVWSIIRGQELDSKNPRNTDRSKNGAQEFKRTAYRFYWDKHLLGVRTTQRWDRAYALVIIRWESCSCSSNEVALAREADLWAQLYRESYGVGLAKVLV